MVLDARSGEARLKYCGGDRKSINQFESGALGGDFGLPWLISSLSETRKGGKELAEYGADEDIAEREKKVL